MRCICLSVVGVEALIFMSPDSEHKSAAVAMDGDEGGGALLPSWDLRPNPGTLTPSWDRLLTAGELEDEFLGISPASPSSLGWNF